MVNGEIGGGLYKAYGIIEQWVVFQWLYSGSTVGLQRTKNEQWKNKKRRMNEQWTNKERTMNEQWTNKRRTKDEQKTNNERTINEEWTNDEWR